MKIYILHGWSYSLDKWEPFVSILKRKKLSTVLLKIPGLTEKIDAPWAMDNYVSWLSEKLEKEKDKVILIGHSNGGRIAMAFAMKHKNKVEKLILIDSAGIHHNEPYMRYKRKVFGMIAKNGRKILNNKIGKNILYFLAREGDYKDADGNMKKTMVNLLEWDKNLVPEKIDIPTLIIWGGKDGITPLSDGKVLHQRIINSKLSIIDDARHSPQFTHSEKVAEIIYKNL